MSIPRKTLEETKAEWYSYGYQRALYEAQEHWRERMLADWPRRNLYVERLWTELLRFMDCEASRADNEYKKVAMPRLYGVSPADFVWKCQCGEPERHPRSIDKDT